MPNGRSKADVSITNRDVDLFAEGFDIAIRLGQLRDSSLAVRKFEEARLCIVASPEYLQPMGKPKTVGELADHHCLPFLMPSTGRDAPWLFRWRDEDIEWTPPGQVPVMNDVLGTVYLAQSDPGIC